MAYVPSRTSQFAHQPLDGRCLSLKVALWHNILLPQLEEGAQMDFDQTWRWHSRAEGGDRQMGWEGVMWEQNLYPVLFGESRGCGALYIFIEMW